jgi:ubiquinone/menaquinone biosynthesis C-methylase UbiE
MSLRIATAATDAVGAHSAGHRQRSALFAASAEAYDRFMGRYTPDLAQGLADAAGIGSGMQVLDVGCGPGGLTGELVDRVGAGNVAAIDPAPQFAAACQDRHRGVDVRIGVAEDLPWTERSFDSVLACLVIGFVDDPALAVREMVRVTRPGGVVAACMWDLAEGGMAMLRMFWSAMGMVSPATDEVGRPGRARGDIAEMFRAAGLRAVTDGELQSRASYTGFEDFWEPFTGGVGPAGQALAALPPAPRTVVRETCRSFLPARPFTLTARAWYATGRVPADSARGR